MVVLQCPSLQRPWAPPARVQRPCTISRSSSIAWAPQNPPPQQQRQQRRHWQQQRAAAAEVAGPAAAAPKELERATATDAAFMRRALELARRGEGHTHPNPAVGCVLVDPASGRVVGEGYHPRAGMPHAEVYALRAAGRAAEGATAYVTLEPCNHYGRTPPCSRALVAAGVGRVVVGCADPNPLVGGCGVATLRAAGIPVAVGCEEAACYQLNAEFMARMEAQAAADQAAAAQGAAAAGGAC